MVVAATRTGRLAPRILERDARRMAADDVAFHLTWRHLARLAHKELTDRGEDSPAGTPRSAPGHRKEIP